MNNSSQQTSLFKNAVRFISLSGVCVLVGVGLGMLTLAMDISMNLVPRWVIIGCGTLFAAAALVALRCRDFNGLGLGLLMLVTTGFALYWHVNVVDIQGAKDNSSAMTDVFLLVATHVIPLVAPLFSIGINMRNFASQGRSERGLA